MQVHKVTLGPEVSTRTPKVSLQYPCDQVVLTSKAEPVSLVTIAVKTWPLTYADSQCDLISSFLGSQLFEANVH